MKTNKEYLCEALGIRGKACFRTVSELTGLSVDEIVKLDKHFPENNDIRAISYHFTGKRRCKEGLYVVGYGWQGYDNLMYWRGVLDAMREKETDSL